MTDYEIPRLKWSDGGMLKDDKGGYVFYVDYKNLENSLAGDTCARLVNLCQELIGYLEAVEESDSGRQFHPTTISSCRCMVAARLGEIIREMKSICENEKEEV